MDNPNNIEKFLSSMEELELPHGYDARFYNKLESQENSSWLKKLSLLPTNFGWAVALGSFLIVSLRILERRKEQIEDPESAASDEIDMLSDLDVLMAWNGEDQS